MQNSSYTWVLWLGYINYLLENVKVDFMYWKKKRDPSVMAFHSIIKFNMGQQFYISRTIWSYGFQIFRVQYVFGWYAIHHFFFVIFTFCSQRLDNTVQISSLFKLWVSWVIRPLIIYDMWRMITLVLLSEWKVGGISRKVFTSTMLHSVYSSAFHEANLVLSNLR